MIRALVLVRVQVLMVLAVAVPEMKMGWSTGMRCRGRTKTMMGSAPLQVRGASIRTGAAPLTKAVAAAGRAVAVARARAVRVAMEGRARTAA